MQQLASKAENHYSHASRTVLRDLYVDDILTGVDNIMEAKQLINELLKLLQLGQFELHKWRSNYTEKLFGL